jgi:ParB family chromosome partitioning protein
VCGADVAGPDAGGEAVLARVGAAQYLVGVVEGQHRQYGAEDLLAGTGHVVAGVGDDRGRVEEPVAGHVGAEVDGRALLAGQPNVAGDALLLTGVDERPQVGGPVEAVARTQAVAEGVQPFDDLVVYRTVHEQSRRRAAGLAGVPEQPACGARDGGVQVGVAEDDVRALAAELERDALDLLGGPAADVLPDGGRAREGDLVDGGVLDQGTPRDVPAAGDDVQHACRQAGLARQLGEPERGQRRLLRRLHHHRASRGERGGELPAAQQQREVPRGDGADHPDGVLLRADVDPRVRDGDGGAHDFGRPPGEVVEGAGRKVDVDGAGRPADLAGVEDLQLGELVGPVEDRVPDTVQDAATVDRAHPTPLAGRVERPGRGLHGPGDVGRVARRGGRDGAAGGGVQHGQRLAAQRRLRLPVDEHVRFEGEPLGDGGGDGGGLDGQRHR